MAPGDLQHRLIMLSAAFLVNDCVYCNCPSCTCSASKAGKKLQPIAEKGRTSTNGAEASGRQTLSSDEDESYHIPGERHIPKKATTPMAEIPKTTNEDESTSFQKNRGDRSSSTSSLPLTVPFIKSATNIAEKWSLDERHIPKKVFRPMAEIPKEAQRKQHSETISSVSITVSESNSSKCLREQQKSDSLHVPKKVYMPMIIMPKEEQKNVLNLSSTEKISSLVMAKKLDDRKMPYNITVASVSAKFSTVSQQQTLKDSYVEASILHSDTRDVPIISQNSSILKRSQLKCDEIKSADESTTIKVISKDNREDRKQSTTSGRSRSSEVSGTSARADIHIPKKVYRPMAKPIEATISVSSIPAKGDVSTTSISRQKTAERRRSVAGGQSLSSAVSSTSARDEIHIPKKVYWPMAKPIQVTSSILITSKNSKSTAPVTPQETAERRRSAASGRSRSFEISGTSARADIHIPKKVYRPMVKQTEVAPVGISLKNGESLTVQEAAERKRSVGSRRSRSSEVSSASTRADIHIPKKVYKPMIKHIEAVSISTSPKKDESITVQETAERKSITSRRSRSSELSGTSSIHIPKKVYRPMMKIPKSEDIQQDQTSLNKAVVTSEEKHAVSGAESHKDDKYLPKKLFTPMKEIPRRLTEKRSASVYSVLGSVASGQSRTSVVSCASIRDNIHIPKKVHKPMMKIPAIERVQHVHVDSNTEIMDNTIAASPSQQKVSNELSEQISSRKEDKEIPKKIFRAPRALGEIRSVSAYSALEMSYRKSSEIPDERHIPKKVFEPMQNISKENNERKRNHDVDVRFVQKKHSISSLQIPQKVLQPILKVPKLAHRLSASNFASTLSFKKKHTSVKEKVDESEKATHTLIAEPDSEGLYSYVRTVTNVTGQSIEIGKNEMEYIDDASSVHDEQQRCRHKFSMKRGFRQLFSQEKYSSR